MTNRVPVSPAELLMVIVNNEVDRTLIPAGAVVGQATDAQQQAGVVAIVASGDGRPEMYAPILWPRLQMRCVAPTLSHTDRMGRHLYELLHDHPRTEVRDSEGNEWLVNGVYISTAPSDHWDSAETWENLLFATMCVATQPIP